MRCAPRSARTRTSCSSARCATSRPSPSRWRRRRPATSSSGPCTPIPRPRRWTASSTPTALLQVEDEHFRVALAGQLEPLLVAHRGAVAFAEPLAVQLDLAPRHVHPGMAPGNRFVDGALALVEEREVEGSVLVDG